MRERMRRHTILLIAKLCEPKRQRSFTGIQLCAVLAWLLTVAGCATNIASLPQLPGGGGGGNFSFTPSSPNPLPLLDSVAGRSYNFSLQTSGGSTLLTCSVTPSLPPGFNNISTSSNSCGITGTPTTAGSFPITVQAIDTSSPAHTATQSYTLVVNAALTLKVHSGAPSPNPAPAAVQGRTYGNTASTCGGSSCSPLSFDVAGGLGNYKFTPPAQLASPGAGVPGPAACALTSSGTSGSFTGQISCNSTASLTAAPGSYNFSIAIDDTANNATQSASLSGTAPSSISGSIQVNAPLTLPVSPDPVSNPAVSGRSYGTGSGCSGPGGNCSPLTYTATNGLGTYVFTLPSAPNLPPTGITCSQTSTTTVACSGAGVTGNASMFSISVADTASASTPAGNVSVAKTIAVNPEMVVSAPTPDPNVNPAVIGRLYGELPQAAPTYPLNSNGGLGGYKCGFTASSSLPTNVGCTIVSTSSGNSVGVKTSGTGVNDSTPAVATTFNFTVTATDTANATTPANTVSYSGPQKSITVNPPLALTPPSGSLPPAVTNRSYGQGTNCGTTGTSPCATINYSISGGLGNYSGPGTLMDTSADVFSCSLSGTTYSCSSSKITGSTGNASLTFTAGETGNGSTPGSNVVDSTKNLPTNTPLAPGASVPPATLPPGVTQRNYGVSTDTCGGGAACAPVTYTVTGGLAPYVWPTTLTNAPAGFACTITGANNSTNNCSAKPVIGAASPYSGITTTVSDTANASVPAATAPLTFPTSSLTINAVLSAGATVPAVTLPAGVTQRNYGVSTDTCASATPCAPITYSVAGGLVPYVWAPALTNAPAGFACAATGTNNSVDNCSAKPVVGAPNTYNGIATTVSDTANASVPSAVFNTFSPSSLTVSAALALVPDPASVDPPTPGVQGRTYGNTSAGFKALVYDASGGLGTPYTFTLPASVTAPVTNGVPTAVACTNGTTTATCSSGASPIGGPTAPFTTALGSYPFAITVSDAANTATPSGTSSGTAGSIARTIKVNGPLNLTLDPTSVDPPPAGVQGRAYGNVVAGFKALIYDASGGSGVYAFTLPPQVNAPAANGAPSPVACTSSATAASCSSGTSPIGGPAAPFSTAVGSYPFMISVNDVASATTPNGSGSGTTASVSKTIVVNAALTLTPDPTASAPPDASQGRSYGTAAGKLPLTYAPAGGNPPYTVFTCSGLPLGLGCTLGTNLVVDSSASGVITEVVAPGTTRSFPLNNSICVSDTIDQSTPFGSTCAPPSSITVHPTLTGQVVLPPRIGGGVAPQMPNLLKQGDYTGGNSFAFQADGSLGPIACALASGTLPPGFNALSNCSTGGIPNTVGSNTFQISVTDSGNTSVPATSAVINNTPFVLDTLAYAANPTSDTVEVITTTNASGNTPTAAAPIPMPAGSAPTGVAATPDGLHVYVTLLGSNKFAVIDTTTNAQIAGSPFALPVGCTGPRGIAVTPDGARFYVACSTSNEILAIRTSDNTTVDATFVLGAGSIPDSVAVRPDGKRVYVTQGGASFDQVFFIDNTTTPPATIGTFALTAASPGPAGIAIAPHGAKFYAYIAKQNPGSGNIGAVDVFDVTTDLPTSIASLPTGANTQPLAIAFDPSDATAARIYATLSGTDQFVVIDNTANPPSIIGAAQNLPDPLGAATDTPMGIAFPPHNTGATAQAYIAISNNNQVDVIDNNAPPSIAIGSPVVVITGTARLAGIAVIPLPH